ncbi:hypothetical protein [Phormidesmis sp. 146-33]
MYQASQLEDFYRQIYPNGGHSMEKICLVWLCFSIEMGDRTEQTSFF